MKSRVDMLECCQVVPPYHGCGLAHRIADLIARNGDIVQVDKLPHSHNSDQATQRPIEQRHKEDSLFIYLVEIEPICVSLLDGGYVGS